MESSTCDPLTNLNTNISSEPAATCEDMRRMSDCPCRLNAVADDNNVQRLMEAEINRQNFLQQELNDSTAVVANSDANAMGNGIFSRVPSDHYKVGKYLMAVHRKITRQDSYFLSHHKTRPSIFGVPLIIPNLEGGTNKDLYWAVWLQVSRLLSPLPASTDQANHAADWYVSGHS